MSGNYRYIHPERKMVFAVMSNHLGSDAIAQANGVSQRTVQRANIDLVPGHMIVSMDNQVHIISWETLKPYWSPAIGIVHVDPLRDHAYRLWALRRRMYGVDDEVWAL
ncbi:hypothetical protein B0H14DRAFT_3503894 [Mycena olivaceomarginata]|nr:hypothetical protein B0H14DRAFT_3503894 [Mycena olivaceomarginata]